MKKLILIIMLMFVVGCNNDIVEPVDNFNSAKYIVIGNGEIVSFYFIDDDNIIIKHDNVTLPYTELMNEFSGDKLECGIASLNLTNYSNISIEMYYNEELVHVEIPTPTELHVSAIHFLD